MKPSILYAPVLGAAACALLPPPVLAQEAPARTVTELASLSIEELAQIEVRSASKTLEPLSRAATSIFVLTDDDITRSAATSLPEALRLAPNLQVQRLDGRLYAVTARGFNGYETSNKLLVLIDGRSVYTPLQSGVFWELHAPLLEDIRQIEVISGPGGTLFGPNAVNGVINIASKDAHQTLGGLARATVGANERTAALRYGTSLGETGAVRVYANGFDKEDLPNGTGPDPDDHFKGWQAGFRADLGGGGGRVTVQGDIFDNALDTGTGDGNRGHNLLARWNRELGGASALQVQGYYDDFQRRFTLVKDKLETFDLEAQVNTKKGAHDLVVGAGARTTRDAFINNLNGFVLDPERRRLWVFNAFAQDRIALSPQLDLIAGLKLERSSFSGVQVLPNLRLAWHPDAQTLLWGSVSRAVRTPSRIDRQLVFLPVLAQADDFQTEKLIAIEAGYRGQPAASTSLSVSLFYNLYDDIRTTEFTGNPLPIKLRNSLEGETYGVEAWVNQQIAGWWRASLGATAIGKDFDLKGGAVDLANRASLGADPDFQIVARSHMDLSRRVQLDLGLRAMDDLNETGIGGYVEADARLSWRASRMLELYVAGNNLLHARHAESIDPARAQLSERSVFVGSRVRF
ncbi:MAG TPA: TonB-dependent receptor [Allosphingosinicella sp.]|nr:TonB-dependent receptor [Allosphingosinicella sp.]